MTKTQFVAATQRVRDEEAKAEQDGEAPEPEILEFDIAGQNFTLHVPTTSQVILLSTASDGNTMRGMMAASMEFLEGLMTGTSYRRFRKLVSNGTVDYDLLVGGDENNDHGIIDWIVEQISDGRPPQPSTGSSPSPATGGRRSTGRVPGTGSTQSVSP